MHPVFQQTALSHRYSTMRIGYACINMTLAAESQIQVNRSMIRKTFLSNGVAYASELALKNVTDFEKVCDWNIRNNILLYRMSSNMFPWMSEYELDELPDYQQIKDTLQRIGAKAKAHSLRLTYHPGPFNVLATNRDNVLQNTIKELRQHGEVMDMLLLPRSPFAKINIHVGGAYGDKDSAILRFIENYALLPETVKRRLTVENDDKPNMYAVKDLIKIYEATGVPVVFDYLHHQFCTGRLTEAEAMLLAHNTWPENITPVFHYSSSKKKFEDPLSSGPAHADFIYEKINCYGKNVDLILEAKAKEKATLKYIKDFNIG